MILNFGVCKLNHGMEEAQSLRLIAEPLDKVQAKKTGNTGTPCEG